ncbi:hypothetical protein THMIRHAM_18410 [Thiomicrorhabdus immobilis]|uniref:Response regulatory domain-containing protein n=1 Tax=Thiomicrorhabdus immobilis TaxID=2791037 RepID=A0ABN6CYH3_9GAMM|nr:hypothetical protein [Thiomicrorhabdus immobilis]BCN94056.1 hypothetical protein THMIRHAM_18410 [Thiomicrorhabdus immobilis]
MSFKEKLIWLQGKKVAVCDTDKTRAAEIKAFLQHYGVDVIWMRTAQEMLADLESRRYSTHRVFFAVFVSADLAHNLSQPWAEIVKVNPSILKAPLILMGSSQQISDSADLMKAGYFAHCLINPISPHEMLRVLRRLNRWNAMRGDTTPAAILAK